MEPFILTGPDVPRTPIVANIPHCGTYLPEEMLRTIRPERRSLPDTDWHVDRLYGFLPDLGVSVLQATFNRYVIDPNRRLTEPLLGPIADAAIATETFAGLPIYDEPPSEQSVEERVERFYRPYHRRLQALIDACVDRFGHAFLIDLHSFDGVPAADICLGDDDGRLDSATLMGCLEENLAGPFHVVKNEVWTGGHITIHYGRQANVEAVQIETDHALYLEEEELARATGEELGMLSPPDWNSERFEVARRGLEEAFQTIVAELS